MRYAAVLFDLDGTLIEDTSEYSSDALVAGLQHVGVDTSREAITNLGYIGLGREMIFQFYGLTPETVVTVLDVRHQTYVALMREKNIWRPGAPAVLKTIGHSPRAIVTGARASHVNAVDEALGLRSHIPVIIAAEDMGERKKPDPYGLLLATEKMGVPPEKCLYVGDQGYDIEAATYAGMDAVLIRSVFTPADVVHVTTITSLEELLQYL